MVIYTCRSPWSESTEALGPRSPKEYDFEAKLLLLSSADMFAGGGVASEFVLPLRSLHNSSEARRLDLSGSSVDWSEGDDEDEAEAA